jgi:hypothetical protein
MIQVDRWLDRTRSQHYRCFDFVREVWLATFGEDVGDRLKHFLNERQFALSDIKKCKVLNKPVDPCFVLMQRDRRIEPHIGIWHRGKVLHLAGTGAQYLRLEAVAFRYTRITFFL